jgi:outer membrane protein TolC
MIQNQKKKMHMPLRNNYLLCILALVYCSSGAMAQTAPVTKKAEPIGPATRQIDRPMDIREKLVQMALQNPDFEIADRKVAIANYQVSKAKGSWLSIIGVQGNLNEFSLKGSTVDPVTGREYNPGSFYPKYNIGASIPFDFFSAKKNDVKIAKENVSIAQAEKNQRFREIKAQVLTKYEDYLLIQQKLEFQSQVTQDARTAYLAAEKEFQEGGIKQDEYNKSYRGYTDEKMRQAEFQRDYNVVKLDLERMIGISMDDLMKK